MWKEIDKTKGPIYRQMMDQIMKNIENGNLAPGERLPSERKLAAAFRRKRTLCQSNGMGKVFCSTNQLA